MNVKSTGCSTTYDSLFFQSSPIISTLDHVKGLIEAYNTKFVTEENIIISAKWLLEKINQLEDISIKRECLCRLLKLEIEEIQNLIVQEIVPLLNLETIPYDIQYDQAQQLIHLEEIISETIESKLNLGQVNFFPICMIYQGILEHLWLLPYLESSNHCAKLIQNENAILKNMERWKNNLDQLASEKKISPFIPTNLKKAVQRLFQPLPEAVAKDIEEQKLVIHKCGEMTSRMIEIMMKVCSDQEDFPRAIFHAEVFLKFLIQRLSGISQKKEWLASIMQIHEKIVDWYEKLRMYQEAILHVEKALKIARELDDSYAIFIYLKKTGYFYSAQGQHDLALPFYQEAQTIAKILKDPKGERLILGSLAKVYTCIGSNEEAIRCYQATLKLAEEKTEQALIYSRIGEAHAGAKQYKEAEEAYEEALEILPQGNKPLMAIRVHQNLTILFNNIGRYEKTIFHAEKILELIQHPSVQTDEAQAQESKFSALVTLGNIYGTFGDYARELDYHTQALEINEKPNFFSQPLEITYGNLGNAYGNVKNYSESIDYYNKALRITKDITLRAKIFLNMANLWGELGKFDKTLELYEEANKIRNLEIKKYSLLGLGVCYDIMGNKEQAIKCIKKSIGLSQASKDCINEALGYHNLGQVYSKSDLRLAEENYRKSIAISAALHQELKNHHQWQITFFEEQAKTILSLESLLLKQSKNEEALQVTDFRRSRALVSTLTEKFPFQKVDSLISSGLTPREMQALAQKLKTCFVIYSFPFESKDSITVWVISSEGKIKFKQIPLGILTEEVKAATQIFQTFPFIAEARTIETPLSDFLEELTRGESSDSLNTETLKNFKNRLRNWYEILIAPIESYLPKDSQQVVTIIPNGYLAQIPFVAFLDKEGTYLIEKHPLSIAPSIGVLTLLDQLPKDFPKDSLVIGNPTTSGSQLKFAEKEAQTIVAPLLKTNPERTLLQDSATAQRVLEGMRDARWIHLACHGSTGAKPEEKLDPHSVFEGLFKLAPEQENPNGYLHAQEIAALRLRTELVFMSACFSGRGKLHGEGSVGPVWSFLAAGALSTVATYWRLPDSDLTLQMVETFYRQFLDIGEKKPNKAQALQKAMLLGIKQKRDKPHLWGAFFLSGLHK